jgi:hypothetical protein
MSLPLGVRGQPSRQRTPSSGTKWTRLRRAPLKVPLDIRSASAAPPQRLEQPSRLQTLDHSSALDRRAGRHLYSSAQQEVAQAGRERGHARSRQGALAIVETLHDARGCGYRRGWSIEGRTGPEALNLYKMSCGGGCSRAGRPRGLRRSCGWSAKLGQALRDGIGVWEPRLRARAQERNNAGRQGCPERPRFDRANVGSLEPGQSLC